MPAVELKETEAELEFFLRRIKKEAGKENLSLGNLAKKAQKSAAKLPKSRLRTTLVNEFAFIRKHAAKSEANLKTGGQVKDRADLTQLGLKFLFLVSASLRLTSKIPPHKQAQRFYKKLITRVRKLAADVTGYFRNTAKDDTTESLLAKHVYATETYRKLPEQKEAELVVHDALLLSYGALLNCDNEQNRRAVNKIIAVLESVTGKEPLLRTKVDEIIGKHTATLKIADTFSPNHQKILHLLLCELFSDDSNPAIAALQERILSLFEASLLNPEEIAQVSQYKKQLEVVSLKQHYLYYQELLVILGVRGIALDIADWAKQLVDTCQRPQPPASHDLDRAIAFFLNRKVQPSDIADVVALHAALPRDCKQRTAIEKYVAENFMPMTIVTQMQFVCQLLQHIMAGQQVGCSFVTLIYQVSQNTDSDQRHKIMATESVSLYEVIEQYNRFARKQRTTLELIYPAKFSEQDKTGVSSAKTYGVLFPNNQGGINNWPSEVKKLCDKYKATFKFKRGSVRGKIQKLLDFVLYRNPIPAKDQSLVTVYEALPVDIHGKKLLADYLVARFAELDRDLQIRFLWALFKAQKETKAVDERIENLICEANKNTPLSYKIKIAGKEASLESLIAAQNKFLVKHGQPEFVETADAGQLALQFSLSVDGENHDIIFWRKFADKLIRDRETVTLEIKAILDECWSRISSILSPAFSAALQAIGTRDKANILITQLSKESFSELNAKLARLKGKMPATKFSVLKHQLQLATSLEQREQALSQLADPPMFSKKESLFFEFALRFFTLYFYAARQSGQHARFVAVADCLVVVEHFPGILKAIGNENPNGEEIEQELTLTATGEELLSEKLLVRLFAHEGFHRIINSLEEKDIEAYAQYVCEKTLRVLSAKPPHQVAATMEIMVNNLLIASIEQPSKAVVQELEAKGLNKPFNSAAKKAMEDESTSGNSVATPERALAKSFSTVEIKQIRRRINFEYQEEADSSIKADKIFDSIVALAEVVAKEQKFVHDMQLILDVVCQVEQSTKGDFSEIKRLLQPFTVDVFADLQPQALSAYLEKSANPDSAIYKNLKKQIAEDMSGYLAGLKENITRLEEAVTSPIFSEHRVVKILLYNQSYDTAIKDFLAQQVSDSTTQKTVATLINEQLSARSIRVKADGFLIKPCQKFPLYGVTIGDLEKSYKEMFPLTKRFNKINASLSHSGKYVKGEIFSRKTLPSSARQSIRFGGSPYSNLLLSHTPTSRTTPGDMRHADPQTPYRAPASSSSTMS